MNRIPKVVGGIYRVIDDSVCRQLGGKVGDLCVLIEDDDSEAPVFKSEAWYSGCYINLFRLEFIGVMKYE